MEKTVKQVLSNPDYDLQIVHEALRTHGLPFAQRVFSGLVQETLAIKYEDRHCQRLINAIYVYYERHDPENLEMLDRSLAGIELSIPRPSEAEVFRREEEAARQATLCQIRYLKERLNQALEDYMK